MEIRRVVLALLLLLVLIPPFIVESSRYEYKETELYPRIDGDHIVVIATSSTPVMYPSSMSLTYMGSLDYRYDVGWYAPWSVPSYKYIILKKEVKLSKNPSILEFEEDNRLLFTYFPSLSVNAREETQNFLLATKVIDAFTITLLVSVPGRFEKIPSTTGIYNLTQLIVEENDGQDYAEAEYHVEILRYPADSEPPAVTSCSEWDQLPEDERRDQECYVLEGTFKLSYRDLYLYLYRIYVSTWFILKEPYKIFGNEKNIVFIAPSATIGVTFKMDGPDDGYSVSGILEYRVYGEVYQKEIKFISARYSYAEFDDVPAIPANYSAKPLQMTLKLGFSSIGVELMGRDRNFGGYIFFLDQPFVYLYKEPLSGGIYGNATITGHFNKNPPLSGAPSITLSVYGYLVNTPCSGVFSKTIEIDPKSTDYLYTQITFPVLCPSDTEMDDLRSSKTNISITLSIPSDTKTFTYSVPNAVLSPSSISYWVMIFYRVISNILALGLLALSIVYVGNELYAYFRERYFLNPEFLQFSLIGIFSFFFLFNVAVPLTYRAYACLMGQVFQGTSYASMLNTLCYSVNLSPEYAVALLALYGDLLYMKIEAGFAQFVVFGLIQIYMNFVIAGAIIASIITLGIILFILRRSTMVFAIISGLLGLMLSFLTFLVMLMIMIAGASVFLTVAKILPLIVITIIMSIIGVSTIMVVVPHPMSQRMAMELFGSTLFFLLIVPLIFPVSYILYCEMMDISLRYSVYFENIALNIMQTVYPIPLKTVYLMVAYLLSTYVALTVLLATLVIVLSRIEIARGAGEGLYIFVLSMRR